MKRSARRKEHTRQTIRNAVIGIVLAVLAVWVGFIFGSNHSLSKQNPKSADTNNLNSRTVTENSSSKQKESFSGGDDANSSSQTNNLDKQESSNRMTIRQYSQTEKVEAQDNFLEWAKSKAQKGNLVVTERFFDHGASGKGDWFAETEDGKALVQQQSADNPGYNAYKIHVLGGVTFYTSKDGTTGYDEAVMQNSTADGIANFADKSHPIHKYLLCDNGVVYEAIGSYIELVAFSSPFSLYDDDGQTEIMSNSVKFKVSQDQAAQNEWKRILATL